MMEEPSDDWGNCYEVSRLTRLATDGDARAAAELWRELATDTSSANDTDLRAWLQYIAKRLVADVIDGDMPANRKAEAARRAVGLSGQIGDFALRDYVAEQDSMFKEFSPIAEDGTPMPIEERPLQWQDHVQMAMRVIDQGFVEAAPVGKEKAHIVTVAKRIERIRQDLA
jgi:hypothetical protein